jgi:glutathione S-transferase
VLLFFERTRKLPVKIYTTRLSPYGNRIYVWAAVKAVSLEFVPPPGGTGSPEFKKINRSGKIPVVVEDGCVIPESMIILDYLEDRFPSPSLRLRNPALRARTLAAVQIHDLYVMPEFNPVFAQLAQPQMDDSAVDRIFAAVTERLPLILATLPAGNTFAGGSELSLADCAMAPFFLLYKSVAMNLGRSNPIETHTRLAQWSAALLQQREMLPAVQSMQAAFGAFLQRFGRTAIPVV